MVFSSQTERMLRAHIIAFVMGIGFSGVLTAADNVAEGAWKTHSVVEGVGGGQSWRLEGNVARLNYITAGQKNRLATNVPGVAGGYYRLSFLLRGAGKVEESTLTVQILVPGLDPVYEKYTIRDGSQKANFAFYTDKTQAVRVNWYVEGNDAAQVELDDLVIEKLDETDLSKLEVNSGWRASGGEWLNSEKKPQADFTPGTESLLLAGGGTIKSFVALDNKFVRLTSSGIAIVPGKRYRVSSWMKCDGAEPVRAELLLDGAASSPVVGEHWYHVQGFSVGPTGKEYSFLVDVPADSEFPCLRARIAKIKVGVKGEENATLIFKDVKCVEVP